MTTPQHVRAGKLVRLLASDKPGEVAAAAAALDRVLNACGHDLHWLANVVVAALVDAPALVPLDDDCGDWRSIARFCHHHRDRLPAKEVDFINTVLTYREPPSPKQIKWLRDLYARLHRGRR
jgi:hypothetical protein